MNPVPARPPRGSVAEYAVLGLLASAEDGAGHGYDLARRFAAGTPLGSVLRLEAGMVYHHVKKLERLGWVRSVSEGGQRPARRTVAITPAGRAELARWLGEPVQHTREIRLEFLVKLYLALLLDRPVVLRLIAEQDAVLQQRTGLLAGAESAELEAGESGFPGLVRTLRQAQTEAAVSWLGRVRQRLGE